MRNRLKIVLSFGLVAFLAVSNPWLLVGQESTPVSSRILNWAEADQIAWLTSHLDNGMPPGDAFAMLVLNRSAIVLPVLEKKIEDIVRAANPRELFSNQTVDPDEVVRLAVSSIAYAGDEQALKEASKLMQIDEDRFGNLVGRTLICATNRGNPFVLAYRGFVLGDPAVDRRIIVWLEEKLTYKKESIQKIFRRSWAEAMISRYSGVPTTIQMANDPIAIRLKPTEYAGLESDLKRLTIEAAQAINHQIH